MAGKLSALKVRNLTAPGRYGDGGGLWLQVRGAERRSWLFRYKRQSRAHWMGLGPFEDVTLAEARELAREARRVLLKGDDPMEQRRSDRSARAGVSFREVADLYIKSHESTWRNATHRAQWRSTLETYAFPVFGDRPAAEITVGDVMKVLDPIWREKPETASRLRGRIESVLDYATARGWRTGDNPARWRGHLANLLPARSKVARVEHHAALPWCEAGAFMADLRGQKGIGAAALEFAILTAARTGEVIGARWGELDLAERIWTVPAERMKAHREHRVPLTEAALAVLRRMAPGRPGQGDGTVFPGAKGGRPLSNMSLAAVLKRMGRGALTVHGFRSTFRDWVAEATEYPREVAEAALAHTLRDKVEAAYRRGDLFEKRRRMMEDWAAFCEIKLNERPQTLVV
jgi:integrase